MMVLLFFYYTNIKHYDNPTVYNIIDITYMRFIAFISVNISCTTPVRRWERFKYTVCSVLNYVLHQLVLRAEIIC